MSTATDGAPPQGAAILMRLLGGESLGELAGIPASDLETVYAKAYGELEQERFDEALDLLLFLVTQNPYDVRFQFAYGLCLQQLGHDEDAARHYGYAYVLDPSDAACAYRIGECLCALGERDAAIEAFRSAIALTALPGANPDVRGLAEAGLDRLQEA